MATRADQRRPAGFPRPRLIDRTADQCGYDYGLETSPEPYWALEVKAVSDGPISLTKPQWKKAKKMGDCYWLAVVDDKEPGEPKVSLVRDPTKVFSPKKVVRRVIETSYQIGAKELRRVLAEHAVTEDTSGSSKESSDRSA